MALEAVKEYVRSRMTALTYIEWTDGFNFTNISSNLLNNRWHMEFGRADAVKQNQQPLELEWPFTLRIFKAPTIDPRTLIDQTIVSCDAILKDVLKAENRLKFAGTSALNSLKNLRFNSLRLEALNETNDNGVIGIMEFSAYIVVNID